MPEQRLAEMSVSDLMAQARDDFDLQVRPMRNMALGIALLDRRFEQVDQRFEQVDQRFEQVDRRFEQVDQRIDKLEAKVDHGFEKLGKEVGLVHDNVQVLMARFEVIGKHIEMDERKVQR